MNRRLSSILLLAFLVAAISSYLVYRVAGKRLHPGPQQQTTKIIVAAKDLPIGTIIADNDITTANWTGTVPQGALLSKKDVVGRGVISDLYKGEPIFDKRLAAAGSGGGLAATIKPGMRAAAVRVDEVVGVAGFVLPGMRVDVLVSGNAPGAPASEGTKVKTLLQNIEVLSAGTNIQKDNDGKPIQVPVVTLLVTPKQAELLSLASNHTKIQLVLRNPLDTKTPDTPTIAMASVFSDKRTAPEPRRPARRRAAPVRDPKPAPPEVYLIQVYNGGKHTQEKFADLQPH